MAGTFIAVNHENLPMEDAYA